MKYLSELKDANEHAKPSGNAERSQNDVDQPQKNQSGRANWLRVLPFDSFFKKARKRMATLAAVILGVSLIVSGLWILALRFEAFADLVRPHSMLIGQINVDGTENKSYAELFRARFDHHFRNPVAITRGSGFLEIASLDAPELFKAAESNSKLEKMTVDISGVDVGKVLRFINLLARPDQWVIEGDFQTQPDKALLALRFSRGDRLIRTWYLDRPISQNTEKAAVLQELVDDAVFQLVYDFGNKGERDNELRKWQEVVPPPADFPTRAAVSAYYQGRSSLARYYAGGDWNDLSTALENLQMLRGQMPDFVDGLQLLALALAEKRNEQDAIHVYEQVHLLLSSKAPNWEKLSWKEKRAIRSIDLLKDTAIVKLDTWQSTHEAIADLQAHEEQLQDELKSAPAAEAAAYRELLAHTQIQLANAYAQYLIHLRDFAVAEVFGDASAPKELRVSGPEIEALKHSAATTAKPIVRRVATQIVETQARWLASAEAEKDKIDWSQFPGESERRRRELDTRIALTRGFVDYHISEWETADPKPAETVMGANYSEQMAEAQRWLSEADKTHPNHYLVLQLLGMVYSEPRQSHRDLSLAEQYFDRAVRANPFDYSGHELLADLRLRRVATRGVDPLNRSTIEQGLKEARAAVDLRETSGTAHLLWAEALAMLLEIERDQAVRLDLRATLVRHADQADRFLSHPFGSPDPDLSWILLISDIQQTRDNPAGQPSSSGFQNVKGNLLKKADNLIADCARLEDRWVNNHRVFHIKELNRNAKDLRDQIQHASTGKEIAIRFW